MIIKSLLLLSVFLVPLIRPVSYFGYEQTKVFFLLVFLSLAGIFWLGQGIRWTRISQMAGLFILILLVTSLTGTDLKSSLLGREPYFQGWIVYAYLFLFSLMVSRAKIKIEHWAVVLTGSAALVSILAIYDWVLINFFQRQIPTYAGRVVSTFGQPNFYAGFLVLTVPFSYVLLKNSNRKVQYLAWGSSLITGTGIFLSYSRTAILIFLALLLFGVMLKMKLRFRVGLVILGAALFGIFAAEEVVKPVLTKNPDLTRESVEKRAYIWPVALKVIGQNSLVGYGLENTGNAFSSYFDKNKHTLFEENLKVSPVLLSLKELNIDRTHNYLLDLLVFGGVPALLAWIFLILLLLSRSRGILMVSLVIYLVWVQFQNQSIIHLFYFWLLVGLIDRT